MTATAVETPGIAQLAPILLDIGLAPPAGVAFLSGGDCGSFRIDLEDGETVVLKTYGGRSQTPHREAYASRLLHDVDFPMTRYLAIDETLAILPYRFAVTNFLPGVDARAFKGDPDAGTIYREIGALLRRLHAVKMPAYGHFTDAGMTAPAYATNEERVRAALPYHFAQFRKYGADEGLALRLEMLAEARLAAAVPSAGAVFALDDLHPGNVVAARNADGRPRLTGLIDFGNAHAADPVWDLAKILFICAHEAPESPPLIREGYGPIDHPDPEGAIWFYTLLHRVIMWWWLRHVGVIAEGAHNPLIDDLREMAA